MTEYHYIRRNKPKLSEAITVWKTDLTNYKELVQRIKDTKKERQSLIAQKKETSGWNIPKQKELSGQIAELAELLEELQSEKLMLLESMSCEEDNPVPAVQKTIKTLEKRLATLETREDEYTDAMEQALQEYASLQTQAKEAELNPVELHTARIVICDTSEDTAANHLRKVYGEKYSPLLMMESRKEVDRLLNAKDDTLAIQKVIQMEPQIDTNRNQCQKRKRDGYER